MDGTISMLQNQLIPIVLIYIVFIIGTHVVKKCLLKTNDNEIHIKTITEITRIVNIWATGVCVITIVIVVFFLSSPLERTVIKTTTEATVDETSQPPTKEEISISNKEVIESKHLAKEQEAEADNNTAMESAADIFTKAAQKSDTKK